MDEIREVALAYYGNSSEETKTKAKSFFKSMDADGDGKININEFEEYVTKRWRRFKPEIFTELDRDEDGLLDFEEALVFYYMVNMRNSFCDGCGKYLNALYFTCVRCFLTSKQTYDLCLTCYKTKHYNHDHSRFLDNYVMLDSIWSDTKKKGSKNKELNAAEKEIEFMGDAVEFTCNIFDILTSQDVST